MSYYNPGDEVIYTPRGCGAKIIQAMPGDSYVVEFEDRDLIPPTMTIPGQYLKPKPVPTLFGGFHPDDILGMPTFANKETNCPRCGTRWTETHGFKETFYDCTRCNLKRENA